MRIMAHVSRDPHLCHLFRTSGDIYNLLASKIFGKPVDIVNKNERDQAKVICLGKFELDILNDLLLLCRCYLWDGGKYCRAEIRNRFKFSSEDYELFLHSFSYFERMDGKC